MTVIAWDGKTLAVDKQLTTGLTKSIGTKFKRLGDGTLVTWCGTVANALIMLQWWEAGADPESFPDFGESDEYPSLVFAFPDGRIAQLDHQPILMPCEDKYWAWGSGREIALGAMACGANAKQAVEAACLHHITCGMGVDSFDIKQ